MAPRSKSASSDNSDDSGDDRKAKKDAKKERKYSPPARRAPQRRRSPSRSQESRTRTRRRSRTRSRSRSRSRRVRGRGGLGRRGGRSRSRSAGRRSPAGRAPPSRMRSDRKVERVGPKVAPPSDLPVLAFRDEILDLLIENNFIVVVGETGSGKTTQIPQYLMDSDRFKKLFTDDRNLRIAITQPRRVAAVAMARRVAQERGARLGEEVGYTIRFEDHSSPDTGLRYMTDGCLLRECLNDPTLSAYHVVILDEAHERSLHTDVLFALMKRAVESRQGQLRVLVTSATLDTGAFSEYFHNCPVVQVPGRCFAVDMHYHPVSKQQRVEAAVNVALNLHVREGPGHILVFLTGMEECEQATTLANKKMQELVDLGKEVGDCLIVPLYGMMQSDDQRNVFEPVGPEVRKLVFSTNIAETSLTIDGVGFVVDCGYCKQKIFNPKTGMESLVITEVSQVQATQRAGRAGRTQNGKCFRLYSEESFNRSLPKVTVPEILRSNLASVVLQMKAMGIHDVVHFDFMEAPDKTRLVKSLRLLFLLGAVDIDGHLTDLGRLMGEFPLEPQFSRCLIEGERLGCIGDVLTLVSLLSSEGVWYRPSRQNAEQIRLAQEAQAEFVHPLGDHSTLLNVYKAWEDNGCDMQWCKDNFIHQRALRQAKDIRKQLCDALRKGNVQFNDGAKRSDEGMLKALCAGFYMQSARQCSAGGGWITTGENVLVKAEGGSGLDGAHCEWVLYTELVGNTVAHVLMRNVSAVQHSWLKPFLPTLKEVDLKRLVGEDPAKKKKVDPSTEKTAEEVAKEKETKVSSARERFLARKKG